MPTIAIVFRMVGEAAVDQNSFEPTFAAMALPLRLASRVFVVGAKDGQKRFLVVIDFALLGPTRASAASDCVTETDLVPRLM
jgi:hypothetical protein